MKLSKDFELKAFAKSKKIVKTISFPSTYYIFFFSETTSFVQLNVNKDWSHKKL